MRCEKNGARLRGYSRLWRFPLRFSRFQAV